MEQAVSWSADLREWWRLSDSNGKSNAVGEIHAAEQPIMDLPSRLWRVNRQSAIGTAV